MDDVKRPTYYVVESEKLGEELELEGAMVQNSMVESQYFPHKLLLCNINDCIGMDESTTQVINLKESLLDVFPIRDVIGKYTNEALVDYYTFDGKPLRAAVREEDTMDLSFVDNLI